METDEEQVEKVKAWLKENGMSIVLGIVIGVGGLFGYRYWVDLQETTAAEASGHFVQMMTALEAGDNDAANEQAERLIDDHADSDYALLAQLALAKIRVQNGDFEQAETALQQVVGSAAQRPLAYVARARLAAVQLQRQQYEQALSTLAAEFPPQFAALVEELRGDIYAMQGNASAAAEAYRKAQVANPGPANAEFLRQKLDDLGSTS